MRRACSCALLPFTALLIHAGCRVEAAPPAGAPPPRLWAGAFGYLSGGVVARSEFFGDVKGVEPGTGLTFTVPPLAPATFALTTVVVLGLAGGGDGEVFGLYGVMGEPAIWTSGVSDASKEIISDLSFDLNFSWSDHHDATYNDTMSFTAVSLGARIGGARRWIPRFYFCGGWGWYGLDFEAPARTDAYPSGPYWAAGAEFFVNGAPGAYGALGIEYREHYFLGDDTAGNPIEGGCRQLCLQISAYW